MKTILTKSNQTLAAELKKLGFQRGIGVFDKSDFSKRIWTSNKFTNEKTNTVLITVTIFNDAIRGNDWKIGKVVIQTLAFTNSMRFDNSGIDLDTEAQIELAETLTEINKIKKGIN